MATIGDLPNEILQILFKIFEQVKDKKLLTRTCKRWNELIANFLRLKIDLAHTGNIKKFLATKFTRSYRKLTISGVMLMRSDFYWSNPLQRFSKRIRLEGDPYLLMRKCLQLIRQYEPTLRELSLTFGPLMDKSLLAFLPRCEGQSPLESLKIEFNSWYLLKPDDWIIDRIEAVAEDGLQEVSEMPKLKTLQFEDRRSQGDRTVRRKFFDTMVRKGKAIADISLTCTHYACYADFRIARSFSSQLQELSCVIWPRFVKDFFMLTFPKVKTLKLNFAFCTTTPDSAQFFENARSLIDLTVINVHNVEFFQQGVYRSASLERLTINGKHEIVMDGLQGLDRLKELYLCAWVDSDEQNSVPCSRTLEKLAIDRCTAGYSFYSSLADKVPQLTELQITGDEQLDDECLRIISTTMVNIRRLKLTVLSFVEEPITDAGFQCIGQLRKLEYLFLEATEDEDDFFNRYHLFLNFSSWVQLLSASEVHLKGFRKFYLHHLLDFLLNANLRTLTLEQCGKGSRMIEGIRKLKQLVGDFRPLPHIAIINPW